MIDIDIYSEIGYNFNFPFIRVLEQDKIRKDERATKILIEQLNKIQEEVTETFEEAKTGNIYSVAFETMNVIQSCETMLHILGSVNDEYRFFSDKMKYCDYEIIDEAKRRTFTENNERGYYD